MKIIFLLAFTDQYNYQLGKSVHCATSDHYEFRAQCALEQVLVVVFFLNEIAKLRVISRSTQNNNKKELQPQ